MKQNEINYFVRNINGNRSLFHVVVNGSRYANTSRCIVVEMQKVNGVWCDKPKAVRKSIVYGKLKGFSVPISDKEIWDVIDINLSARERQKDFDELRAYFDQPNSADVETWHESGETVATNKLWTPFFSIPNDIL